MQSVDKLAFRNMKNLLLLMAMMSLSVSNLLAQQFTKKQIDSVKSSCDSISGPGKKVIGDGRGGWRSGSDGILYSGAYAADPRWRPMAHTYFSGNAVKDGLLPPIKPLLELHLRDTQICLGPDGNYYMTGASGDNIWAYAAGIELWKSDDLRHWQYMGLIWSIEKDGIWERKWRNLHDKPARAIWAPEIHYIHGNYFITTNRLK